MFQQQMQIQMAAMEKHAETSEKFFDELRRRSDVINVRGVVMMTKTTVLMMTSRHLKNKFNI